MGKMKVTYAGDGGIDEMRTHLNPEAVQFGLFSFVFGSGTFAKTKWILVQFNGPNMNAVKKAKAASNRGPAVKALGEIHAELFMGSVEECSVDWVFKELSTKIKGDDGTFNLEELKKNYKKQVEVAQKAEKKGVKLTDASGRRLTAAELADLPGEITLKETRAPMGAFNWCLFTPHESKLEMFNAGSLSINEMIEWLKEQEVLYGLLRMGFGKGVFRRTKWVGIWWRGDEVKPMMMGKLVALQDKCLKRVDPVSLTVVAQHKGEISVEIIIEKVKRAAVLDGDADQQDAYSMESFMAALDEEKLASAKFFAGYKPKVIEKPPEPSNEKFTYPSDFDECLKLLRQAPNGPLNWGLFEYEA